MEHSTGSIESCVATIQRGDLLAIYPGGTKEAFLADNYDVLWKKDAGFAKIAHLTKCVGFFLFVLVLCISEDS